MCASKSNLGVFPTPDHIVSEINRIVFQLLRKQNSSSSLRMPIRVLDNSVGDGRFLFDFAQKWVIYEKKASTPTKLHLFGVDIDPQSIEKCENKLEKFKEFQNIKFFFKLGNSLLGYINKPILDNKFINDFQLNEIRKEDLLTFFHWFRELKDVEDGKGFHICIGNPPFGIDYSQSTKKIFKQLYNSVDPEVESYILFVERSIALLGNQGILALLIPNNFATNLRYKKFRKLILEKLVIKKIVNLEYSTFSNASVETCVLIGVKKPLVNVKSRNKIKFLYFNKKKDLTEIGTCFQDEIRASEHLHIGSFMNSMHTDIINQIKKNSIPLGDIVSINRGIELGFTSQFTSDRLKSSGSVELVAGRNILPFKLQGTTRYIEFDSSNKRIYKDRSIYEKPKILLRRIGHKLIALYDPNYLFCVCDVYLLSLKPQWRHLPELYIVSILNSPVLNFFLNQQFRSVKKIFPKIPIEYLKRLPIVIPNSVEKIDEISLLASKIEDSLDRSEIESIFKLVYEIYGLLTVEQARIHDFLLLMK
ncbi:MAG: TaqI-like C-terminal specificity domain-containing protein [Candidatus Hodarchaeales archaeon]